MLGDIEILYTASRPITGASASKRRNQSTIFLFCLFLSMTITVLMPSVKSCDITAKATTKPIAGLTWNAAPMAIPSKRLWIIRLAAPTGPIICPCVSSPSESSCVAKNLSRRLYAKNEKTTAIIRYLMGKFTSCASSILSGKRSKKDTATRLQAANAKK